MAKRWASLPYAALLAALLTLIFFAVPVCYLVLMSFAQHSATEGVRWSFSLANYAAFLNDGYFWEVAWRTLRLSLLTTLICLLLAFPVSHYLVTARGWRQLVVFIILLTPLVTSVTVMSYGWLVLLGQKGLVNAVLVGAGILSGPASLIHNETAIVIGLVHIFIVFMVISIAGSLHAMNPALALAARSLGAGPTSVFMRITLPLCLPGIRAGALLVFALSMSSYAIRAFLEAHATSSFPRSSISSPSASSTGRKGRHWRCPLLVITLLVLAFAYLLGGFTQLRPRQMP